MRVNQRKIGVIITYLTLGFNVLMGLFYTPFMIFKLGDGEYGIYSLSSSLVAFVTLLDLGFGQTLVRYISKARTTGSIEEEHKLNGLFLKLYCAVSLIALIVGIGIIIIYPRLAEKALSQEELSLFRNVFIILLINVVISFPMSVFSATLNAYEEFFFLKLSNFIISIVKYGIMFLLLYIGCKLVPIVVVVLIFSLLLQFSYLVYAIKKIGIKFDFSKPEMNLTKEIFKFSFYIFLNLIIDFLYSNTDKLILGIVSGTVCVSVYSIGIYFSQYFTELSTAMSGVFMPKIMALYQKGDIEEISNVFNKVGRLQMALLFLVLGGYICFGREFINLWVGTTYNDSYLIGIVILLPSIVPLTQNMGITIIRAMNIHKYRSYMYIVIAILNVAISIPLAIRYNGIGSAIGTGIATLLGQIIFMNWFYNHKVGINIKEYWKNFASFSLLSLVTVIFCYICKRIVYIYTWRLFVMFILLFTIIYLFGYFVFIANTYERNMFLGILKKCRRV